MTRPGHAHSQSRPSKQKGHHQIDFLIYFDLDASGVTDARFASAKDSCKLSFIALPKEGARFSVINPYKQRPLFSDRVRTAFNTHYFYMRKRNTIPYINALTKFKLNRQLDTERHTR